MLSRRTFLNNLGRVAAVGALSGAAGLGYANRVAPFDYEITRTRIPVADLAPDLEGFRVVHLSDFHAEELRLSYFEQIVNEVNALEPDIVAMTGDFVTRDPKAAYDLAPILAQLRARYGVFSCFGNHDLWAGEEAMRRGFEASGLSVFIDEGQLLTVGEAQLYVAGSADAWHRPPVLDVLFEKIPEGTPSIVMVHEPDAFDEVAGDARVSVQLSGHSHGGQIKLPFVGPPFLPGRGRKYPEGLYRLRGTQLYTTRGVGVSGLPLRFNCRPEISALSLERA